MSEQKQMDERTLTALQKAIAKWERMASDDREDAYGAEKLRCPLCVLFNPPDKNSETDCVGCPIFQKTKRRYCNGTPYEKFSEADDVEDDEMKQTWAYEEVEFLKALLPARP